MSMTKRNEGGRGRARGVPWSRGGGVQQRRRPPAGVGTALEDLDVDRREVRAQLNLIAWVGYTEDGTTRLRLGQPFENQTGCKVTVKYADTSDEMVNLMTQEAAPRTTACRPRVTRPTG